MTDSQLDPESQARLLAAVNAAPDPGEQPCSRPHGDAPCRDVETDRDQWQQRAEQAEAAVERVRAVVHWLRHEDAVRILAALDGPGQPAEPASAEPCGPDGCAHPDQHAPCPAATPEPDRWQLPAVSYGSSELHGHTDQPHPEETDHA